MFLALTKWLGVSMRPLSPAVIAALLVFEFGRIASAADEGTGRPIAPPLYNWAGPYIGIAGGYAWGHSKQTDPGIPCDFFWYLPDNRTC